MKAVSQTNTFHINYDYMCFSGLHGWKDLVKIYFAIQALAALRGGGAGAWQQVPHFWKPEGAPHLRKKNKN